MNKDNRAEDILRLVCDCEDEGCPRKIIVKGILVEIRWKAEARARKKAIKECVNKLDELTWYHNDEGVKELEDNTDYLSVKEVKEILNQL